MVRVPAQGENLERRKYPSHLRENRGSRRFRSYKICTFVSPFCRRKARLYLHSDLRVWKIRLEFSTFSVT